MKTYMRSNQFPQWIIFESFSLMQFLKIFLFCYFLISSSDLLSQNREIEKKRIIENKIKTTTCSRCEYIFGKPDSCEILSITKYDKKGNVIEVISSPDKVYSVINYYTYAASGNLLEIKQITGKDTTIWKNEYDSYGRKTKQVTYKNRLKTAEYKDQYQNEKLISTTGYTIQRKLIYLSKNRYNLNGKVIENLFFDGTDTTVTKHIYSKNDKQFTSTGQIVNELFYDQDTIALKRCIRKDKSIHEEKFQYDNERRVTQIVYRDSGSYNNIQIVNYDYDLKGNKIAEITTDRNLPNRYSKIQYEYDSSGNLVTSFHPHNNLGKTSKSYSYNDKKQLSTIIDYSSDNDSTTYQYSYDEIGNKIQEIKKHHNIIYTNEYEYDVNRKLIKENNYTAMTDNPKRIMTQTIEYEYNNSENVSKATYKNFQMDLFYQKHKLQDSTGKFPDKNSKYPPLIYSITYKYDDRNNLTEEYEDKVVNKSSGYNASSRKYYYNDNNKLIEKRTYYFNSEKISSKSIFEYDSKGNLIIEKIIRGNQERPSQIIHYYYNAENQLADEFNYSFNGKQASHKKYFYNAIGKNIEERVFEPDDSLMRYSYDHY